MWPLFFAEINVTENILRLVRHFGAAWCNFGKFHVFSAARCKNGKLFQIGAIDAAVAPLNYVLTEWSGLCVNHSKYFCCICHR